MTTSVRTRRILLYGLCSTVFVLGLLFGAARVTATAAARELETAWEQLSAVAGPGASVDGALQALRQAELRVDAAEQTLDRFDVRAVAAIPFVGRSLDAERDVVDAASAGLRAARTAAQGVPEIRAGDGGIDLAALSRLETSLRAPMEAAEAELEDLRATSTALTPPVVADGVERARSSLTSSLASLRDAQQALRLAQGLLGGAEERAVLVALENNAELRGSGGYVASFATGTLVDGELQLEPLRDVLAVADPPEQARRVPAPEEFQEDFAQHAADTTIWRSWNMSPDVPQAALVGATVAGELLGTTPDVLVLLDVPAMAALAALGEGSITLPGGDVVSPEDLARSLLVDSYAEAGSDMLAQDRRRGELQAAATEAVTRLLGGAVEPLDTVRTLARLVEGRHLKVWSARPEEQRQLEELGAAGAVAAPDGDDLLHISVNNLSGNKLDVHVARDVQAEVVVHRDQAEVVQRVRFANEAPEGLVPYVAGVDRPGTVVSRVEFSLPPAAELTSASVDGEPLVGTVRAGQSRQRVATRIELPRGATSQLEVSYTLPVEDGDYRLRLLPQPLAIDASLDLTVRAADGQRIGSVEGAPREGDQVVETGEFSDAHDVRVSLADDGRWARWRSAVADFWSSPVEIG